MMIGKAMGPSKKDLAFLEWLEDNGAKIDGVQWPTTDDSITSRGAVAKRDFVSGEPMLEIPENIMITPKRCRECPALSKVYELHSEYFEADDDRVLTLYLMHERLQGDESFWQPYLAVLPEPGSICHWDPAELLELQDRSLVGEAKRRPSRMKSEYESMMNRLHTSFPGEFLEDKYSFELYKWAWMTIQARAFGRRLPFGALVPFADCLNHANKATKYDLQPESYSTHGYRTFRLYPSGVNAYKAGEEVFNSYGRRTNRFLLLEYGFALDENEWDSVDVYTFIDAKMGISLYPEKVKLLSSYAKSTFHVSRIHVRGMCNRLIQFLRLKHLNEEELEECQRLALNQKPGELGLPWASMVSIRNELDAVVDLVRILQQKLDEHPTTIQQDTNILAELSEGNSFNKLFAVRYRLCRKRIILTHLEFAQSMLQPLKFWSRVGTQPSLTKFAQCAAKEYLLPLVSWECKKNSEKTMKNTSEKKQNVSQGAISPTMEMMNLEVTENKEDRQQ